MNRFTKWCFSLAVLSISIAAQSSTKALVTREIHNEQRTRLSASVQVPPRGAVDLGTVEDDVDGGHMLLMLGRSAEQDQDLENFLTAAQQPGSATYHHWLTPEEFGRRFGPAESDLDAASNWLRSQGFDVVRVSHGRQLIQFSGKVGALRQAFHAEIHRYKIGGVTALANTKPLEVPTALAPLIRGMAPLSTYRAQPQIHKTGAALYTKSNHQFKPTWTIPNGQQTFYALAPEDFATQYDVTPLLNAGVNGNGQTIGIINESNIDLSLVAAYRKLFGLPDNVPQVVIDGDDPGEIPEIDIEAYLDVEQSGAVAPAATIKLYVGNTENMVVGTPSSLHLVDPLYMAALRAVEDNQASVLSVSFGECEGFLLASGNAMWSALWQQAAAQGQTVLVSSGDSGSAGCDNGNTQWQVGGGLAVNGLASTPWNIAVGGTDFYYPDYRSGGASAATMWSQTNDNKNGSLKAPLSEQVWDTAYGLNAGLIYHANQQQSVSAAGGGASSCINSEVSTGDGPLPFICPTSGPYPMGGYVKPAWQAGTGVPTDQVRDIPDLSLFASSGLNYSGYPICAVRGDCDTSNGTDTAITIVGGTSASAPAMAGIFALINQKYGRQGQANPTLYGLAKQVPAAFHDVSIGSNNVPCLAGSPNCSPDNNGDGLQSLQAYAAQPGYDLASGLGSIDAQVLVSNWNAIHFAPTTTTLTLTPASTTHGAPVTINIMVKAGSGGSTPTGAVSLVAEFESDTLTPLGTFPLLNGSASASLSNMPGGNYRVRAVYGGDASFASSQSAELAVNISAVASTTNLYLSATTPVFSSIENPCVFDSNQGVTSASTNGGPFMPLNNGDMLPAGGQVSLMAIVNGTWPTNASNNWPQLGSGTGSVTFSIDGTPQATIAVNQYGFARWTPPTMLNAGTHNFSAAYSGDSGNTASTSTATINVPRVSIPLSAWPGSNCTNQTTTTPSCTLNAGDTLRVQISTTMANCHIPTGKFTVNLGTQQQAVALKPGGFNATYYHALSMVPIMHGEAVFENLPAGTYQMTATYSGDINSLPVSSADVLQNIGQSPATYSITATSTATTPAPTTISMSVSPASPFYRLPTSVYLSATVTGSVTPPTGTVIFYDDGYQVATAQLHPNGNHSSVAQIAAPGSAIDIGSSEIKAIYAGDSANQSSSVSNTYQISIDNDTDFMLTSQSPQIHVAAGASTSSNLTLRSFGGYTGTVTLTCQPSSTLLTCSITPSTVQLNGQATVALNITAQASAAPAPSKAAYSRKLPMVAGICAAGLLLLRPRKMRIAMLMLITVALFTSVSACGGSFHSGVTPTPTPLPLVPNGYSVVVTATADGHIHNTAINVLVP